MISAKKAEEKIIKRLKNNKTIKSINDSIKNRIELNHFEYSFYISDGNDLNNFTSLFDFSIALYRYYSYYGYNVIINRDNDKRYGVTIKW